MKCEVVMKMVFKAWMLLLVLFCLPVVFSDDSIFKVNEVADLKVPCLNNDSYCSAVAICNATVLFPNGDVFVEDAAMTNSGSYFNFTMNASNTSTIGVYKLQVTCFDGVDPGYSLLEFKITSSGMEGLFGDALVPALILIALLVFCAFMAYKLPDEEYGMKVLFIGFALFLLVIMIRMSALILTDDVVNSAALLNTAFWAFVPVVVFVLFYVVVVKFLFGKILLNFSKEYKDRKQGKD